MSPLVTPSWLERELGASDLVVLDGSWYLPAMNRDARKDYKAGHLPGALFFDLEEMSDPASPFPHMLPSPEEFAAKAGALGIGANERIVVYDGAGLFSAPRIWWMFRAMGHEAIFVLNGGLPKWKAEGYRLESGVVTRGPRSFTAKPRRELIRARTQIEANLSSAHETVVDARAPSRFAGAESEPRPGLRAGHIPGSRNVHWASLVAPDGTLRDDRSIETAFEAAGVSFERPIATSCGSGVSACILALALETLGYKNIPVYDGSWAEWGADRALPIETNEN